MTEDGLPLTDGSVYTNDIKTRRVMDVFLLVDPEREGTTNAFEL
jgi:hypothetical protein